MVQAYCVKCRKKGVEMVDAYITPTKKGFGARGKCPKCSTNMAVIISKDTMEKLKQQGFEIR